MSEIDMAKIITVGLLKSLQFSISFFCSQSRTNQHDY